MRFIVPLFFFHIVTARATLVDDDGMRLANSAAARAHAQDLTAELARSLQPLSGTMIVECDDNGELFEVPLSGALE